MRQNRLQKTLAQSIQRLGHGTLCGANGFKVLVHLGPQRLFGCVQGHALSRAEQQGFARGHRSPLGVFQREHHVPLITNHREMVRLRVTGQRCISGLCLDLEGLLKRLACGPKIGLQQTLRHVLLNGLHPQSHALL